MPLGASESHDGCLTCPCVAPHTAKIHTLNTLGVSILAKPLVLKPRRRVPRGFDSHRPLHLSLSGVPLRCLRTLLRLWANHRSNQPSPLPGPVARPCDRTQ